MLPAFTGIYVSAQGTFFVYFHVPVGLFPQMIYKVQYLRDKRSVNTNLCSTRAGGFMCQLFRMAPKCIKIHMENANRTATLFDRPQFELWHFMACSSSTNDVHSLPDTLNTAKSANNFICTTAPLHNVSPIAKTKAGPGYASNPRSAVPACPFACQSVEPTNKITVLSLLTIRFIIKL